MRMTTYTVFSNTTGEAIKRQLSLEDVAIELLSRDGREFAIRPEDGIFRLWLSRDGGANRELEPTGITSRLNDAAAARYNILQLVTYGENWFGASALPDDLYDSFTADGYQAEPSWTVRRQEARGSVSDAAVSRPSAVKNTLL